jgi:hypothetical protein
MKTLVIGTIAIIGLTLLALVASINTAVTTAVWLQ